MPTVEFALGVIPAKERPRQGRGGHFYTPKKTKDAENTIKEIAAAACLAANVNDPTDSDVTIWLWVETPPRGDTDNSLKLIKDALQGVIYTNDRQVSREHVHRSPAGAGSYIRLEWDTNLPCCRHITMPAQRTRRAAPAY